MTIKTALLALKEKYPKIQLEFDWKDNKWKVSLFDNESHYKDEAIDGDIIGALKKLVDRNIYPLGIIY